MHSFRLHVVGIVLWAATGTAGAAEAADATVPPGRSATFHDGSPGSCEGCHGSAGGGTSTGLRGSDASSTCLRCHAETGSPVNILSGDGSSFTPGGDFYWLRKTFTWTRNGRPRTSPGDRHGHNVVALDHGLEPDATLTTSPGGQFPAAALGCTSCHDPHQASGAAAGRGAAGGRTPYRLLGGASFVPAGGTVQFQHAAPVAVAPTSWRETDRNHVAYGAGMSEWCSNCHASRNDGSSQQHVVGRHATLGATIADAYNAYVSSGIMTGSRGTAYLALVPFEVDTADPSALDPASTSGPDARARVMCLTCHRAHASAFEYAFRWDFSTTFLADSHPRAGDRGATGSDPVNSYYGRNLAAQFGPYQRSFCNKCHAKD
jgi:predicted CXXCH cytochrome family protein